MKQRNVRAKRWRKYTDYVLRTHIPVWFSYAKGLDRFEDREFFRKLAKQEAQHRARWRIIDRENRRFDQLQKERWRQSKIDEYNSDPSAWWLREAQRAEHNFRYHCDYIEAKWGKPNGSYHRWRRELLAQREILAAYYSSESYRRIRAAEQDRPSLYSLYNPKKYTRALDY